MLGCLQLLSPTMAVLSPKGNKGVRYSCYLRPWLSLATGKQGSEIELLSPTMAVLGHRKQGSDLQLLSPSLAVVGHTETGELDKATLSHGGGPWP